MRRSVATEFSVLDRVATSHDISSQASEVAAKRSLSLRLDSWQGPIKKAIEAFVCSINKTLVH
jgi:hypothetical protein